MAETRDWVYKVAATLDLPYEKVSAAFREHSPFRLNGTYVLVNKSNGGVHNVLRKLDEIKETVESMLDITHTSREIEELLVGTKYERPLLHDEKGLLGRLKQALDDR